MLKKDIEKILKWWRSRARGRIPVVSAVVCPMTSGILGNCENVGGVFLDSAKFLIRISPTAGERTLFHELGHAWAAVNEKLAREITKTKITEKWVTENEAWVNEYATIALKYWNEDTSGVLVCN